RSKRWVTQGTRPPKAQRTEKPAVRTAAPRSAPGRATPAHGDGFISYPWGESSEESQGPAQSERPARPISETSVRARRVAPRLLKQTRNAKEEATRNGRQTPDKSARPDAELEASERAGQSDQRWRGQRGHGQVRRPEEGLRGRCRRRHGHDHPLVVERADWLHREGRGHPRRQRLRVPRARPHAPERGPVREPVEVDRGDPRSEQLSRHEPARVR